MKTNELRIGNKVATLSEEPEVITVDQIDSIEETICGNGLDNISISDLDYISLNEEWLLKFGFTCIDEDDKVYCIGYEENDSMEGIGSYNCDFEVNINDDGSWHVELSSIELHYVHQLQNLYFALKGEELIIE